MNNIHDIMNQAQVDKHVDSILGLVSKIKEDKQSLVKTASTDIDIIDKYIDGDNIKVNVSLNELLESKKKKDDLDDDIDLLEENIKIVSREVKDPHYEAFVSRSKMTRGGEKIFVVSFFLKENYLGRYLISRNFYFLKGNGDKSIKLFEDFIKISKIVRNEYYEEKFESIKIPVLLQNYAMSQNGDVEFQQESKIGTTVYNKHVNEATVYEWFTEKKEKSDEIRYGFLEDIYDEDDLEEDEDDS